MVVQLLLHLLADFVFESAATTSREFNSEMARYFKQHGFYSFPAKHGPEG